MVTKKTPKKKPTKVKTSSKKGGTKTVKKKTSSKTKVRKNKKAKAKIKTKANTWVFYWAAQPQKDSKKINEPAKAYGKEKNSGLLKTNKKGTDTIKNFFIGFSG